MDDATQDDDGTARPARPGSPQLAAHRIEALREIIRGVLVELASPQGTPDPERELDLLDELGHRLNQLGLLVPQPDERNVTQMTLVAEETRRLHEAICTASTRKRYEHYVRRLLGLLVEPATRPVDPDA